jgi:two-component system response regulator HydG
MAQERLKSNLGFGDMVGQSAAMWRLYGMAAKAAVRQHPILLLGESGTGKKVLARAIHDHGPAPERAFVAIDCVSRPASVEAELLGRLNPSSNHQRDRWPPCPSTIFLDEVAALPLELQEKLLQALQERDVRPLAAPKPMPIEARIISSSSGDLETAVRQGVFRRDLYVRLNAVTFRLPALRDRKDDIGLLVDHFLKQITASRGARYSVSTGAMKQLMRHDWPGNVRELKECLEYAVGPSSGPVLDTMDLPPHIRSAALTPAKPFSAKGGKIVPLAEVEKQTILHALERLNGDKLMTARALGIGKTTLYRKLKEYGLQASGVSRS